MPKCFACSEIKDTGDFLGSSWQSRANGVAARALLQPKVTYSPCLVRARRVHPDGAPVRSPSFEPAHALALHRGRGVAIATRAGPQHDVAAAARDHIVLGRARELVALVTGEVRWNLDPRLGRVL